MFTGLMNRDEMMDTLKVRIGLDDTQSALAQLDLQADHQHFMNHIWTVLNPVELPSLENISKVS